MTSIFEFDKFVESSVNPNLRGLGYTGWGETGNPTHCIRFTWNDTTRKVEMTYKLNEADEEWRPQRVFDERSGSWVVPASGRRLFYELISRERSISLLSSFPEIIVDQDISETAKSGILRCSQTFEGTVFLTIFAIPSVIQVSACRVDRGRRLKLGSIIQAKRRICVS